MSRLYVNISLTLLLFSLEMFNRLGALAPCGILGVASACGQSSTLHRTLPWSHVHVLRAWMYPRRPVSVGQVEDCVCDENVICST